jgi:membrane-bound lytic murein transglycosylase F
MRACLLILFAILAAGCTPDPAPRAARPAQVGDYHSAGELRVATRMDAISYRADEDGTISGFEHDVLLALGEHLQVPVRFDVYPDAIKAMDAVLNGHAHIAAAGLARNERLPLRWSSALREVDYILVRRENRAPITEEKDLAGRTVGVRRGGRLRPYGAPHQRHEDERGREHDEAIGGGWDDEGPAAEKKRRDRDRQCAVL